MVIALDDFQIGQQRCIVQVGRHLTHTAAVGVHRLAADIGGCRQITTGLGGGADHVDVADALTGVDHRTVDGFGRQTHVADAVGRTADVGGHRTEGITEQNVLQFLSGHLGKFHGALHHKFCAGFGSFQRSQRRIQIKGNANTGLRRLFLFLVVDGAGHFAAQFFMQGNQINGLGSHGEVLALHRGQRFAFQHFLQPGQQLHGIHLLAVCRLSHVKTVGLVLVETPRAVHHREFQLHTQLFGFGAHGLFVHRPLRQHLRGGKPTVDPIPCVDENVFVTAGLIGGLCHVLSRSRHAQLPQRDLTQLFAVHHQGNLGPIDDGAQPCFPATLCLLFGQAPQLHAQHAGVVENGVGSSCHGADRPAAANQNRRDHAQRDPDSFSLLFGFFQTASRRLFCRFFHDSRLRSLILQGLLANLFHIGPSFCLLVLRQQTAYRISITDWDQKYITNSLQPTLSVVFSGYGW